MNLNEPCETLSDKTDLPIDISCSGGWFVLLQGIVDGPLSDEVFHQKVTRNEITRDTLCWRMGFDEWIEFKSLIQDVEKTENLSHFPSDIFPLTVLLALIICFTVFFVIDSNGENSLAARAQSNVPISQYSRELLDLKICNDSDFDKIFTAVAYYDHELQDWIARGWYPQKRGECKVALKNLTPPIYGFAETVDRKRSWKNEGNFEFCIAGKEAFVFPQALCSDNLFTNRLQKFELLETDSLHGTVEWRIP